MKNTLLITKIFLLLGIMVLVTSCFKNDSIIQGDTKIKFYNTVDEIPQDFYLNGLRPATTTGIGYGKNTEYLVFYGDKEYSILAKNTGKTIVSDSLRQTFEVGKNYSIFYTKTSPTDSLMRVLEDDLTRDTTRSKLLFINLGYSLGSKVVIRDSAGLVSKTLAYGEKTDYIFLKFNGKNKLYFNLVDSAQVVDTLKANSFYKGKVYTIWFDGVSKGANKGELQNHLIVNN